jgi:predicted DNA-binding WGR domain protein
MIQTTLFGLEAQLQSVDPDRNRFRYYRVVLEGDSGKNDGHAVVFKSWGRLKKKRAGRGFVISQKAVKRTKTAVFASYDMALKDFESVIRQKKKRGYSLFV